MGKALQIEYLRVTDVEWGAVSELKNGKVTINKDELMEAIADDLEHFESFDLHIVKPGDKTRILAIQDVMQPRCKVDAPETSYPGIWGKRAMMGEGRTLALKGVVVSDIYYAHLNIKWYLDMFGECAKYS